MYKQLSRGAGAFAFVLAAGCAHAGGNEIVVGEIVDQSPAWIEAGRDYAAGAKTYFDQVNSEGGVNGHKIVHVVKNAGGQGADVMKVADDLLNDSRVDVLFGAIGDATMKSLTDARIADQQNVAVFAPL